VTGPLPPPRVVVVVDLLVVVVAVGGRVDVVAVVVVVVVVLFRCRPLLSVSALLVPSACPWQAATPSISQRPSTLFRQARGWPPAPTHAASSARHARRHCRETDAASAEVPT